MEVGIHWKTERNSKTLDGRLPERKKIRTEVKDEKSEWREVKIEVPHGSSVLAPIMFFKYSRVSFSV